MAGNASAAVPGYPDISPRTGFALVLETACSRFETLRSLIRGEVRCISSAGNMSLRESGSINMALAQSFLFFSARAYRICDQGPSQLQLPREERKHFMKGLAPIVSVRNVNEHGYDPNSGSRGQSSKPSMHMHEEHGAALDETSLIVIGEDKILMGPLNLFDVYTTVDRMRAIAGFGSLPVEESGLPPNIP